MCYYKLIIIAYNSCWFYSIFSRYRATTQLSVHVQHLSHLSVTLIRLSSTVMAFLGQAFSHIPHPVHLTDLVSCRAAALKSLMAESFSCVLI